MDGGSEICKQLSIGCFLVYDFGVTDMLTTSKHTLRPTA